MLLAHRPPADMPGARPEHIATATLFEEGLGFAGDVLGFGGGDREAAAAHDREAFACGGSADPDLARQAVELSATEPEVRQLLDAIVSKVNFAGEIPQTLQERACYWSDIVRRGWPSAGDPPAAERDRLLELVRSAGSTSITVGEAAPEPSQSFGEALGDLFDRIVRPGEIGERAEAAFQGAGAAAEGRAAAQGVSSTTLVILVAVVLGLVWFMTRGAG